MISGCHTLKALNWGKNIMSNKESIINILTKLQVFLMFLYVLTFYMFGADPQKIKYSEVILIVFVGTEIIKLIKRKKIKFAIPIIILFIFDFYCLLSSFWALDTTLAMDKAKTLFILTTFLLVTYNCFSNIDNAEEKLLKIIMFAGIFFSIYVILFYGAETYFTKLLNGERVGTEVNNVNTIGMQTSISIIIAMFFAIYKSNKKYIIPSILPLIVSLGTGSRKVLILIVLGIILLFLLKKDQKINVKKIVILLFLLGMLIGALQLPVFSTIVDRIEMTIQSFTGEAKIDIGRRKFIDVGWKQFLETPILGIGIANSGYLTLKVDGWFTYLHNNYIELLACVGIIGFALYYSVYIYILYYGMKFFNRKDANINLILIIFTANMILEIAMVSYSLKNTYIYILLALLVIERHKNISQNQLNEKNNQRK